MNILSLNSGSSTLKFALFDEQAKGELAGGLVDWQDGSETATLTFRSPAKGDKRSTAKVADSGDIVDWILRSLADNGFDDTIDIVGHRVVHGGTEFSQTTPIDDRVIQTLERISHLAPLHNPPALKAIAAMRRALPEAAHLAVFDTAFFAKLPRHAH